MGWSYKQIRDITEDLRHGIRSTGDEIMERDFWRGLSIEDKERYKDMDYYEINEDASDRLWSTYTPEQKKEINETFIYCGHSNLW